MNAKKLIISAVLPILCLTTVMAQSPAQQDNTPKKGDVTLAVSSGFTTSTNISAYDGNQAVYSVQSMTDKAFSLNVEGGWFVGDRWKLFLGGGMNFTNNPGYPSVPGTMDESASIEDNVGEVPSYRAVADAQSIQYGVTIGIDRYYGVKGVKNLMLYTGLRFGFLYGQNQQLYSEWTAMGKSVAETSNARAAFTFGAEYYVLPGMFVGISIDPFCYNYNVTTYVPQEGLANLSADSHSFGAFAAPTIRLGFKF